MTTDKKKKKQIRNMIIVLCVILLLYFLFDYFDIPSHFGIHIASINVDLLGVFAGVVTAVLIFALTYHFVDQWNILRQLNQKQIALLYITRTYNDCKFYLNCLDIGALQKLIERTDFNAYYNHDSPAAKYADIPFENDQAIMHYAEVGCLPVRVIDSYLKVKDEYSKHILSNVFFFDHPGFVQPTREALVSVIDAAAREASSLQQERQ